MLYIATVLLAIVNGFIFSLLYKLFHSIQKWYLFPLNIVTIIYTIFSFYMPLLIAKNISDYDECYGATLNVVFMLISFYLNLKKRKQH